MIALPLVAANQCIQLLRNSKYDVEVANIQQIRNWDSCPYARQAVMAGSSGVHSLLCAVQATVCGVVSMEVILDGSGGHDPVFSSSGIKQLFVRMTGAVLLPVLSENFWVSLRKQRVAVFYSFSFVMKKQKMCRICSRFDRTICVSIR